MKIYVHYGCGLTAPTEWINFDASPALRIQKIPILGLLFSMFYKTRFPSNIKYGDIVKGLPLGENSCDGLFSSHVLEHLSYSDFLIAIRNSFKILKPEGTFRLIMPNLADIVKDYLIDKESGDSQASVKFIRNTLLGSEAREKGLTGFVKNALGNSHHLWLWDTESAIQELQSAGFKNIRVCKFNDSSDSMFSLVENKSRFVGAIALEMTK